MYTHSPRHKVRYNSDEIIIQSVFNFIGKTRRVSFLSRARLFVGKIDLIPSSCERVLSSESILFYRQFIYSIILDPPPWGFRLILPLFLFSFFCTCRALWLIGWISPLRFPPSASIVFCRVFNVVNSVYSVIFRVSRDVKSTYVRSREIKVFGSARSV